MTLLFKLIWRDLRANPGRVAVSVFAILVSVIPLDRLAEMLN